jgi:SAM-dependent methyltransferase
MDAKKLPENLHVERGQTQIGVNEKVVTYLYNNFKDDPSFSAIDLPCGNGEFLSYEKQLFPNWQLSGCDIVKMQKPGMTIYQMDLNEDFPFPEDTKFDLITSISGVMMLSNSLRFIKNCSSRLKPGGTFIVTNDNNANIKDRLAFMFIGRYRMFNLIFEDDNYLTENLPVSNLVRILHTNGIEIEDIEYTSLYPKDLIFLPFALITYATQYLYLKRLKTRLPEALKWKMYPFKHLLCRHYIVYGKKVN